MSSQALAELALLTICWQKTVAAILCFSAIFRLVDTVNLNIDVTGALPR